MPYPGAPGSFLLTLGRGGAFRLRSACHDLVVDPTVCLFGRAGDPADIAHPYGRGDLGTFIAVSPTVAATLAQTDAGFTGTAPVTGHVARLHQQLLRRLRDGDRFAIEDAALRVFASALGGAHAAGLAGTSPAHKHRRRIVDDACGVLAADPTIDSVVTLGRIVGCSPYHLSRLFRQQIGKTLSRYRLELRVHLALDQLAANSRPLAQIAARSGFADHAHMTRSVRGFVGVTPSGLRAAS